jgi:hypothetical protein
MDYRDPLEEAVADLLGRIPETWTAFDSDSLTERQGQALLLLTAAGMVERRFQAILRMFSRQDCVRCSFVVTGEHGVAEAFDGLVSAIWLDWGESYKQWRESETGDAIPFHCRRGEKEDWRLTDAGLLAREDLQQGRQATVFDFLLKRGYFATRPPVSGKGLLLDYTKEQPVAAPSPVTVNIANWGEGVAQLAKAFTASFEAMWQALKGRGRDHSGGDSPLPRGRGSKAVFERMLKEYVDRHRRAYEQLADEILAGSDQAVKTFQSTFGPAAIAQHWMQDAGVSADDTDEENRLTTAIDRIPLYQDEIKPLLQKPPRAPKDWESRHTEPASENEQLTRLRAKADQHAGNRQ